MPTQPFHVAIVGGGLGGIALGIALKTRNIPFNLYESRGSFTEIGAGINLGPNGYRALRLIDPSLGDKIFILATRNPAPHEHLWMIFRRGAEINGHEDGEVLLELTAPPTGTMTLHRQELLAGLAETMGTENAKFNKKLVGYEQDEEGVVMKFADGTEERASVLVGCDGVHSRVRARMFGEDNPVTKASFTGSGAYRAVVPMEKAIEAWGESARFAQVTLGPGGYFIYYPVNGGKFVNCGAWIRKNGTWDHAEWVVPNQGEQFKQDLKDWGPRIHSMLKHYDPNQDFWACFEHGHQPDHFHEGRVILIGDGAHAMPPHQGQGASQAVEDAYVLAEVLASIDDGDLSNRTIEAGLRAVSETRTPRSSKVHAYSSHAGLNWYSFHENSLNAAEQKEWTEGVRERLRYIWDVDLEKHAEDAKQLYRILIEGPGDQGAAGGSL
ncbi:6-methylsalicylic acid decarboxylase atA [Fulvia fulva]|uniref:6-methylsalicylic acid decarboxylase atA n=1 Tax=Passalora fulva TaxID=5499 RepID=A0A9Q8US99_PASFU|nr:6-methylsalicylic acid decarboxylase atA [Fulvia fulva]KAK4617800.1 6-methylsalicylic acid decarboxylase atA [Fulvia fulva]KAK4618903.1 6-methylsalicylic acid decarboxylase atA [Fulvia fulva]UJO20573.1 6-methylsalicylic acid decarboxylase atA [Fulvia fulva]WPV18602.1 6-methylsalicylic acid decarboxylase atA [Fulvia fulva]WPV33464.1 6-methylsalicylic acid decarboxylase atA [Fulvia fulva]